MPGSTSSIDMRKLSYGPHDDQFGHLHALPSESDRPILIVIHGGYWKDNHTLESYATNALVEKFASSGAAIWNLEYRRMNAEGDNANAPWPTVFLDVAAGMDHLRTIAKSERLDLDNILVLGHSAGGHLAAWTAGRASISETSDLYCEDPVLPAQVISIAGIFDLLQLDGLAQPQQVGRLMGGTPDEFPERYAACNPSQLGVNHIPITVMHGSCDEDVPASQSIDFARGSGAPDVTLIELEGADHFGMLPLDGQEPLEWLALVDYIAGRLELLGAHRPIDPELLPVTEIRPAEMGPVSRDNIEAARQLSKEARAASEDPAPHIVGARHSVSHDDGSIDVYVFQPDGPSNRHALLWFHGGGYVMGTGDDLVGKRLAAVAGCTVVSVDYRLAPEFSFPAAVSDGVAAIGWLRENATTMGIDACKIAIGGASAGAGLAAGVTLQCRDAGFPAPVFQLLMYPMLDNLHDSVSGRVEIYPIWNRATSLNAWEMYLDGAPGSAASQYGAPIRATDLSNLPPTYLCVGDVDLFRDENILFMQKLIADGSPGEFEVFSGVYHAAEQQYPDAGVSQKMVHQIIKKLRSGFESG
jgi:acetyl esterase